MILKVSDVKMLYMMLELYIKLSCVFIMLYMFLLSCRNIVVIYLLNLDMFFKKLWGFGK